MVVPINEGEKKGTVCMKEGAGKYLIIRRWSDVDYSVTSIYNCSCYLNILEAMQRRPS